MLDRSEIEVTDPCYSYTSEIQATDPYVTQIDLR